VTDQELREQLADWFDEIALARGLAISYEELADQTLDLIKEAGYVKLSKVQNLPKDEHWHDYHAHCVYQDAQKEMLNAGFKKVEL
jgi:hypothetical protein